MRGTDERTGSLFMWMWRSEYALIIRCGIFGR